MTSATQIAIEYSLGLKSPDKVLDWAGDQLGKAEADPGLYELFDASPELMSDILFRLSGEPESRDYETALKRILAERSSELLRKKVSPFDFCVFVGKLASQLISPADELAKCPYPQVLGDLYNACDWCDETWTLDNSGHLREIAEGLIEELS